MKWLDFRVFLPCLMLALMTGCGNKATRPPKVERQIAPEYRFRDSAQTKSRIDFRQNLERAAQNLSIGQLDDAERNVRAALRIDPRSADAYTMQAIIDGRRGDNNAAGENYRRAADLEPKRGEVLNNYGAWLCSNGYPAEALVWFDRALNDPNYSTPAAALANAGGCALETGQYDRVESNLRQALDLEPSNAYALMSMAKDEYRLQRYFQARAFIERRISAAPVNPSVLQLAIQIEEKLGDGTAANRYRQRLRAEFPEAAAVNSESNPS
ncbi:MAG: type IV pilus biogenesis/stability protein PilW [Xanthomonadaceae bacterium]|jgi:type IV pilus assembly protein PilF|nr:type IV pilus biogenesis/stability protein PilW [Xanthomonadaceae bacterium]